MKLSHRTTPRPQQGVFRMVARCSKCLGCSRGNGRHFEFRGGLRGAEYGLKIRVSRQCTADRREARRASRGGISVVEVQAAKACVADLVQRTGLFPTPNVVRRELGDRWTSSRNQLKYLLRRIRARQRDVPAAGRRQRMRLGESFADFIQSRRTLAATLCFVSVCLTQTILGLPPGSSSQAAGVLFRFSLPCGVWEVLLGNDILSAAQKIEWPMEAQRVSTLYHLSPSGRQGCVCQGIC